MIEVNRSIVFAHRALRPIAATRQVTPERLHELRTRAFEKECRNLDRLKVVGAGIVKPLATRIYQPALALASKLTDKNIIGVGLEVLVARDGTVGTNHEVTKYATKVNADPRYWRYELAYRHEKAQKVMGKFLVNTEYDLGRLRGQPEPALIFMHQPYLSIVDDGHTAEDMADERGEFRELAEKLARDEGYYFDVIPGHGNLVVYRDFGLRQLVMVDTVIMSKEDKIRPFVPYAPDPREWANWLDSVRPAA